MKKVGIFCCEQHGDIALSTSGLRHKDLLWPGHEVIWFGHVGEHKAHKASYLDMLKHNDAISEVRDWPAFSTMDHWRSFMRDGRLVMDRTGDFDSTKDLDLGFFPAPWCVLPSPAFNGVVYSEISKRIYGGGTLEWHPYLGFCDEERDRAKAFHAALPHAKTVMLETELRSAGMFRIADDAIRSLMAMCRAKWGKVNFIFASKVDHAPFVDDEGVVSAAPGFTVRQVALLHDHCDLFVGCCSGITMSCSSWGRRPVPRIELGGGTHHSSMIAHGPVTSIGSTDRGEQKAGLERALAETLRGIG